MVASAVIHVPHGWYVVSTSSALGKAPLEVNLLNIPLVLFRGADGTPGALLDRCPHRNAPLSAGQVRGANLECPYHGWQFDRAGACQRIPGLVSSGGRARYRVDSYPAREQDGFIWVYGAAGATPDTSPFALPHLDDPSYFTVRQTMDFQASLHAVAENVLDVLHTSFLHRGLFRSGEPQQVDVVVTRTAERVQAEYIGEQRPSGLAGRLLAPRGGAVQHFDRFIMPCITQVEYRLGDASHLIATSALTPLRDRLTRMFATVTFRVPLPGKLVAAGLRPVLMSILKQDADILERQTRVVERFEGEQYSSTELDVLGPHILKLLRQSAEGRSATAPPNVQKTVRMQI